jgi:hypothetical protein
MIVLYVFLSVWAFAALVWFLVALFDLHGRYIYSVACSFQLYCVNGFGVRLN